MMLGTLINVITVLIGGTIGTLIGSRLPSKIRETVVVGLALFTIAYGVMSFFDTDNPLIPLGSLILGAILGEWWKFEDSLTKVGEFAKEYTKHLFSSDNSSHFVEGFVTASLVFCIGPMAILGSIQEGLTGNYNVLAIKAIMDGFAAIVFASTLGVGVLFSAVVLLIYQGSISLLAGLFNTGFSEAMVMEMSAVGGLILIGIAVSSLLEIRKIRIGSFLPALAIAPLIAWLLAIIGVN